MPMPVVGVCISANQIAYLDPKVYVAVVSQQGRLMALLNFTGELKTDFKNDSSWITSASKAAEFIHQFEHGIVICEEPQLLRNAATNATKAHAEFEMRVSEKGFRVLSIKPSIWKKQLLDVSSEKSTETASVEHAIKVYARYYTPPPENLFRKTLQRFWGPRKQPRPPSAPEADALNLAWFGVKHIQDIKAGNYWIGNSRFPRI